MEEDFCIEQQKRSLYLVGYAIGKKPNYRSLFSAIKKKWTFKGKLNLSTMEGDFFLLKFSSIEDYNLVSNHGPFIINDCPFIFKKWSRDSKPVKDDFPDIPIWVKFPSFPLCIWHEIGISKVASAIGIPLTVDSFTASKSRIRFARVCVLITPASILPDSVKLDLNGRILDQAVVYDWKPQICTKCCVFWHDSSSCLYKPNKPLQNRGRSQSCPPRPRLAQQSSSPSKSS